MLSVYDLPTLNATFNGLSFIFLFTGYMFIRHGNRKAHKFCMLTAVVITLLFLTSYLIYHAEVGSVRFTGQGWIRTVYFIILISHTILAMVNVPLVIITLVRAFREKFANHKKIARWTFPLWMYVSLTGVVIYVMLYH